MLDGEPVRFTGVNVWNATDNPAAPEYRGNPLDLSTASAGFGPGIHVVRVWFFQRLATSHGGARDWSTFDNTLRAAREHNLKVIAVLGNQWADCEGYGSAEAGYRSDQWYRAGYRDESPPDQPSTYLGWVREVVSRYRLDPTIMMWQLMNEPEDATSFRGRCPSDAGTMLRSFVSEVGREVRAIDGRHLLGVGTIGSGQCGTADLDYVRLNASRYLDVADYHDYSLDVVPGDQWNGLAVRAHEMAQLGKPLIVSEIGVIPEQVGGLEQRASLVNDKIVADFELGIRAALVWTWQPVAGGAANAASYDVGPGDPLLARLAGLSR